MKKKVLIIEDDKKNMQLERDLLVVAGLEVFMAVDGAGGIVLAQREKPDVIVSDVRLPDMRGAEIARRLREEPKTRDIPIIFVTASVVGEAMAEIKAIPNSVFISKPINTRTFAEVVSRCISGEPHG